MDRERLSRRRMVRGLGAGAAAALARAVPAAPHPGLGFELGAGSLPEKELSSLQAPFTQNPDRVVHLLKRATFGIAPGDLPRARNLGVEGWLNEQLNPASIADGAVAGALNSMLPSLGYSAQRLLDVSEEAEDGGYGVAFDLKRATLYRALYSKRQLFEKMVEFWSNHFSIYHFKDVCAEFKTVDDRDVIRKHALGKFRDLLKASAKSPAMLYYLDNFDNVADGPNENYARELMELHTIGVDAGYTQQDVAEVARCFTGWTIDFREEGTDGEYYYDPYTHDEGPKMVLGNRIAGGRPGFVDGRKVLDLLSTHPACSRFISLKLCRHFVGDTPPPGLVDKVAATFRSTDGDIKAVLRTLFLADDFYAAAESKLKRPYEWLVSALRGLGAKITNVDGLDQMLYSLYGLGQVPFEWESPNGYPDVGVSWANTNGLLNRWNYGAYLALGWFDQVRIDTRLAGPTGAKSVGAFVDAVASMLVQRTLDPADRARLAAFVGEGRPADATVAGWYLNRRAPTLIALLLGSPYFQWR